ncbi:MAG: hypothetical protein K9M75_05425 [Phycisphaerae bacterium]|nr:hypothetical protein [Phycisphaerae bacterium]
MKIFRRIQKKFLLKFLIVLAALWLFWSVCKNVAAKLILPIAVNQIEKHTGSEVEIESVDFQLNGLARMHGVVVSSCLDDSGESPVLTAETITTEFPISSLLCFSPRLKSLTVEDFDMDFRYDLDLSSWNLSLIDSDDEGKKNKSIPALVLKNGSVRFSRVLGGVAEKIISVGVTKGVVAKIENKNVFGFSFDINPSSTGLSGSIGGKLETDESGNTGNLIITSRNFSTGSEPIFGNDWNVRNLRLDMDYDADDITVNKLEWEMGDNCKLSLSGKAMDYSGDVTYSGQVFAENIQVSDKAMVNALVYDEGVLENIGTHLRNFLELYEPKGICDLKFRASGKLKELRKSKWSGTATCKDISIEHKKFPYRLGEIAGEINLSNESIEFSNLTCRHGDAVFEVRGGTKLVEGLRFTDIIVSSENMPLDRDVYRALNKKQQSIWYTFTPKGRAQIKYEYIRRPDQPKGRGTLEVDILDGEADYLHFPYHLQNITGRFTISPEVVEIINMKSGSSDSSITLNGKVTDIRSSKPRYNVRINADNIPLDSRLKAALPYSQRSFYDSFEMKARTDAVIDIFPNEVGERPVEYIAKVKIKDAQMKYENFPLALSHVDVDAVMTPSGTFLKKMTGRNGDGTVEISGEIWPAEKTDTKPKYCLELKASNIQVQDEWLKSLPPDSYDILSKLRLKGAINMDANISSDPLTDCPEFKIVVESLGGSVNYTKFPYPIENITGKVTVEKDKILLENMKSISPVSATDDEEYKKTIAVDGTISLANYKVNKCELSLSAENIDFDDKLKNVLAGYTKLLDKRITPTGRFDLFIDKMTYQYGGENNEVVDFSSKLTLRKFNFENNGILGEINGTLESMGAYKIGEGLLGGSGEYYARKVEVKGRSIENIHGGINYDRQSDSFLCREYTAKCYGGNVLGSFTLKRTKDKKMNYSVETIFSEVDLHDLVTPETNSDGKDDYTKGTVTGYLGVMGIFGNEKSRIGRLNMEISGMKFAERTLLGKIITASQLNKPTDYIFSDITAESYLQKNTLFLDKVQISGKSMRMVGTGSIGISDGAIAMKFNASGKPSKTKVSFLETAARGLGVAVAQVKVDGTFKKPEIETTLLPVFSKPFGILGTRE